MSTATSTSAAKSCRGSFACCGISPNLGAPQDTLTIGKGFALLLSTALYTRLNFFAIAEKLKDQPEKLRALFPGYPDSAPVIARATWDQTAVLWRFSSGVLAASGFHPAGSGSNSWAIAPTRSQTGGALLCNDPHLRMTLPSIWYLMHLRSEESSDIGTITTRYGAQPFPAARSFRSATIAPLPGASPPRSATMSKFIARNCTASSLIAIWSGTSGAGSKPGAS